MMEVTFVSAFGTGGSEVTITHFGRSLGARDQWGSVATSQTLSKKYEMARPTHHRRATRQRVMILAMVHSCVLHRYQFSFTRILQLLCGTVVKVHIRHTQEPPHRTCAGFLAMSYG